MSKFPKYPVFFKCLYLWHKQMSNQLDLGFPFKAKIASYKYRVSLSTHAKVSNIIHAHEKQNDVKLKARHIINYSPVQ